MPDSTNEPYDPPCDPPSDPPSDPPRTVSQYDAHCYAESKQRVANGLLPLLRMEAPTLTVNPAACMTLAQSKGGVRVIRIGEELIGGELGSLAHKAALDGADIAAIFSSVLTDVLFVDRKTVAAAMQTLAESDDGKVSRLAKIIGYLSKQPVINQCSVLTTALGRKYWAPGGPKLADDLDAWASSFKILAGSSRYAMVPELVSLVSAGTLPVFDPLFRNQSATATSAFLRGNKASVDAFTSISQLQDTWKAVENADPVLYARGILTGDTARIVPIERRGQGVVARISTPLKLRPGGTLLLFGYRMGKGLQVVLSHLDFDPAAGELLAIFESPRKSQFSNLRARENGFDVLWRQESMHQEFFAVSEPYIPRNSFRGASKPTAQPRRGSVREIPLDVALAAAASGS